MTYTRVRNSLRTEPETPRETCFGVSDGIPVILYANPSSERFQTFANSLYRFFKSRFLDPEAPITLKVYPIAPDIRNASASIGTEIRHTRRKWFGGDDETLPTQTEVAEAVYAVRDNTNSETMMTYLQNLSKPGDPCLRSRQKLWSYAETVGADPDFVRENVNTGQYKPHVRTNTVKWRGMLPSESYLMDPWEACFFVAGETPAELSQDGICGLIESVLLSELC